MKRVLVLQHTWEDPAGYLGELLEEYHIDYDIIEVESQSVPDPTEYAAVIALGGPQHVYAAEHYPYLEQEKTQLRRVLEENIPYLGICLGGQLLADIVQGQVRRHTMTEIGFFDVQITEAGQTDPLYAHLPGYQKIFHSHQDVIDLPTDAVLLATSAATKNQAFRYGQYAYGLQYHIELSPDVLDIWLYHPEFRESTREVLGNEGYQRLEQTRGDHVAVYYEHTRTMFKNFLKISKVIDRDA